MKLTVSAIFAALAISGLAQAEPVNCTPNSSLWKKASVDYLTNAAQSLFHVRAYGDYLAADMLCSFDKCVGFIDGNVAEGTITLDGSDKPTGFALKVDGVRAMSGSFTCN